MNNTALTQAEIQAQIKSVRKKPRDLIWSKGL